MNMIQKAILFIGILIGTYFLMDEFSGDLTLVNTAIVGVIAGYFLFKDKK